MLFHVYKELGGHSYKAVTMALFLLHHKQAPVTQVPFDLTKIHEPWCISFIDLSLVRLKLA